MIYVTGDIHGDRSRIETYITTLLKPGDHLIVTGEIGRDEKCPEKSGDSFFDYLEKQDCTFLFCDGNHEDFDKLNKYPVSKWNGGRVHKIRKNVIHLIRGEVYDLEGKKIFVMGGGYSLDKEIRTPGYEWWPEEMPNDEEYRNATRNLEANNYKIDYIISHTAPLKTVVHMSTLGIGIESMIREELPLNEYLQWVEEKTNDYYSKWYFGHFHKNIMLREKQYAIFDEVRELESGELVTKIKRKVSE